MVFVGHHVHQFSRHNLPRQTILILKPATLLRFLIAALCEVIPVIVNLLLVFTIDHERYSLIKFEYRPTIHCYKCISVQLKLYAQDHPFGHLVNFMPFLPVIGYPIYL
jgi:hypothetical protein